MKENLTYINKYLKEKFGGRTLKMCVDGNFTCPNRDGKLSTNGCIFCSNRGSGDHLKSIDSIEKQIASYFESYKISRADNFIIYFQNYTNTYDTITNLKAKYDSAIEAFSKCKNSSINFASKKLVGLQIATRPDCITEEIAKLISSYKKELYVVVELGFQTSNDDTKKYINACYTNKDFINAVNILNKYDIDVVTHVMVGLPANNDLGRETHEDITNTINFLNDIKINGIKIHSTYIVKNTFLEKLYNENKYSPLTLDEYLYELEYILNNIREDIIIHRISGDAPKDLLVAPEWNAHKKWVINRLKL